MGEESRDNMTKPKTTTEDAELDAFLREKAKVINDKLKRTAVGVISIGQDLIEVRGRVKPRRYTAWVEDELGISQWTARNFVNVAELAQSSNYQNVNFSRFKPSVLYLLAAKNTPIAVIDRVVSGDLPAMEPAVKEAIREAKAKEEDTSEYPESTVLIMRIEKLEKEREKVEKKLRAIDDEIAEAKLQLSETKQPLEV
jgi:vacuolar-type H+-ATPase subunit I/STV1